MAGLVPAIHVFSFETVKSDQKMPPKMPIVKHPHPVPG
jgi:hypothetical protein